jgi:NADH:ubiquinone oxidoreductase subunit 4 (subunit M)
MKVVSLWVSSVLFYFSLILWILYDATTAKFQFIFWVSWFRFLSPTSFGVDSVSLFFIVLTTFIIPTCLLANWTLSHVEGAAYFILCLFLIEFFLILAFTALDLLTFFFFFESVLIPMFFIIGIWGSRGNKIKASYYFVIYTLFGSLFLLWAIFCIYLEMGSLHIWTFLHSNLGFKKQGLVWICFFIAFSVKIPMFPFHIWLPEAVFFKNLCTKYQIFSWLNFIVILNSI